jgi:hypothetical protein
VKTFISEEDFQRVLELLGLPGETLRFEVGPRNEPMVGIDSSWRLKAVISTAGVMENHEYVELPAERVIRVPVLLPGDVARAEARRQRFAKMLEDDITPESPLWNDDRGSEWLGE